MASLQERLDAAFGSLATGLPSSSETAQEASRSAWKPSAQQVFRSGPIDDANSSDDEEYEEKRRREALPGLAISLLEEDLPDQEGFRPSTAFCRQLDAEEEYTDIDEVATGLLSRRQGGGELLPPRATEVLEDNVYEQRMRQLTASQAASVAAPPGDMELDERRESQPAPAAHTAAMPTPHIGSASVGEPRRSSFAGSDGGSSDARLQRRRVHFEDAAPDLSPGPRAAAQVPSVQKQQGGAGISHVPDHVKHPQKYTCYVLDEPVVVGGGIAQLAPDSQHNQRQQPAALAAPTNEAAQQAMQQEEQERWQGPPGSVAFVSRQQRAGAASTRPAAGAADGLAAAAPAPPGGKKHAAAPQPAMCAAEEEVGEVAEDAAMGDAASQPAPAASAPAKAKRQYRTTRVTASEAE
ncbi:hypothetical protein D9Q98_000505 [Chlorella vulgaris]|uniref:U5 small nuclear ribonucleoprotein TSSC4 n=1 Tax=Chlorella vulgaris TaxID=3077 RepID=A0A9D4TYH2_CHLVU|nr:hypothetical protein D9Q98_000505 [Chlorella vulgaris]